MNDRICKSNNNTLIKLLIISVVFVCVMIMYYMLHNVGLNNKIYKCFPLVNNAVWKNDIEKLANNELFLQSELKKAKSTKLWSEWINKYDIENSPQFTKMSNNEIINRLNSNKGAPNSGKPSWRLYGLILNGEKVESTYKTSFMLTDRLLSIPNIKNAGLSLFEQGAHTELHKGYDNTILRCHIPLEVPNGDTGIEIDGNRIMFKDIQKKNKFMIFNDTCMHIAWNNTNHNRIVLIIDLYK